MNEERICSKCKNKKPISAFSRTNSSRCKLCYNASKREYDARHPEKIRAINHRSYLKHREKRKAYSKEYTRDKRREESQPT